MKFVTLVPLMSLTAALCAFTAPPANGALTDDLAGYWQLDGNGVDSSGNGLTLSFAGDPSFGPGQLGGQALALTGDASQYAFRAVDDASLNFGGNDFSIQIWVNYNDSTGEQIPIEKFSGATGPGWTLSAGNGSNFLFNEIGVGSLAGPTDRTDGVWHQFLVERSGSTLAEYFDDALVASATVSGTLDPSTNGLLIGRRDADDGRGFGINGSIDQVAIWNRALTPSEIGYLYNGGAGNPVPEPSGAVLVGLGAAGLLALRGQRVSQKKGSGRATRQRT